MTIGRVGSHIAHFPEFLLSASAVKAVPSCLVYVAYKEAYRHWLQLHIRKQNDGAEASRDGQAREVSSIQACQQQSKHIS